jgi:dolichol-phosphate hexosyltransferase
MDVAPPRWEQVLLPAELLDGAPVEALPETIAFQAQVEARGSERVSGLLGPVVNGIALKLSILMPVYNEEATVAQAVSEVLNVDYPCAVELIVVDDGSTDGTCDQLPRVDDDRVIVCRHEANRGRGAALLTAASLATGSYILPFDADLEYSAEDIPRLLRPVLAGRCSVVHGTRLFGYNTVYQSYRYAQGNRVLTWLANVLFDARISDLHTCLKLIPMAILEELTLREPGFGLDTEMTALMLKRGVRPFEVPVSFYGRSHSPGRKISWRDEVACVRILFWVRLWSRPAGPARRQPGDSRAYDTAVLRPDQPSLSKAC